MRNAMSLAALVVLVGCGDPEIGDPGTPPPAVAERVEQFCRALRSGDADAVADAIDPETKNAEATRAFWRSRAEEVALWEAIRTAFLDKFGQEAWRGGGSARAVRMATLYTDRRGVLRACDDAARSTPEVDEDRAMIRFDGVVWPMRRHEGTWRLYVGPDVEGETLTADERRLAAQEEALARARGIRRLVERHDTHAAFLAAREEVGDGGEDAPRDESDGEDGSGGD